MPTLLVPTFAIFVEFISWYFSECSPWTWFQACHWCSSKCGASAQGFLSCHYGVGIDWLYWCGKVAWGSPIVREVLVGLKTWNNSLIHVLIHSSCLSYSHRLHTCKTSHNYLNKYFDCLENVKITASRIENMNNKQTTRTHDGQDEWVWSWSNPRGYTRCLVQGRIPTKHTNIGYHFNNIQYGYYMFRRSLVNRWIYVLYFEGQKIPVLVQVDAPIMSYFLDNEEKITRSFSQVGVKIHNISNHHLGYVIQSFEYKIHHLESSSRLKNPSERFLSTIQ